ncbi:MAG: thioredoxin family protein [Candidatus Bathyarchaeia archaeon]|jgi:thiol-disulfide isomerase/thioredoxin
MRSMIEVDSKQDLNIQLKTNEKVLALFYASWCPYCIRFVPVFDKKMVNFSVGSIIHVLLDDYDNPLWDEYSIEAVPTVIFFDKGKVCRRLDGELGVGLNEKQLKAWLEEFKVL